MIIFLSEFIAIHQDGESKSGKTKTFGVFNKKLRKILGRIKWHTGFRKYAFYPSYSTVFEKDCLLYIAEFLKVLMEKHET